MLDDNTIHLSLFRTQYIFRYFSEYLAYIYIYIYIYCILRQQVVIEACLVKDRRLSKREVVTIKSHCWLLQLLQLKQCERACYLSPTFLCVSTSLFPLVKFWCMIVCPNSFSLFQLVYQDYTFWIKKKKKPEAISLPTDAACLNFYEGGKPVFRQFVLNLCFRFEVVNLSFILHYQRRN